MDEPLSNLDAKLRVQMRTEVSRLQDAARHHDGLRHPRPDRGDDARRPRRGHARGHAAAGRHADRALQRPREPVRRRLHRLAGDELHARRGSRATRSSCRWATCRCPRRASGSARRGGRAADRRRAAGELRGRVARRRAPSHGATFEATIDVVESMGSELYAHFTSRARAVQSEQLRELAEDAGGEVPGGGGARWSPGSTRRARAKPKAETEMWINTEKIQLFDPESGKSLERRPPETWRDGAAVGRPARQGPSRIPARLASAGAARRSHPRPASAAPHQTHRPFFNEPLCWMA